jgi:choline dehydrogenase
MPSLSHSFDYIIIGAGSAGCVIARRLAEDPQVRVLLVESGRRATGPSSDMPAALFTLISGRPDLNWNFRSEPEPGLDNRRLPLFAGKTLGGSSQINGLMYARGHRLDYDDWAKAGSGGWSYRDVLPYFKRAESSWAGAGTYHGDCGPLSISSPSDLGLLQSVYRDAAVQAGQGATEDYHGEVSEGFARAEITAKNGRRASTYRAYVMPVLGQPNLSILPGVHTRRVLLEDGRAVGIEYLQNHRLLSLRADREVIVCAGAYGSPQLLMRSGIGSADALRGLGIAATVDLPGVGENLIEHPMLWVNHRIASPSALRSLRLDRAVVAVLHWITSGSGILGTNFCAGHVFTRSAATLDRPDIQLSCFALDKAAQLWFPLIKRRPDYGLGVMTQILRPMSRGRVSLVSNDPEAPPRIQLNLMTDPEDLRVMREAIGYVRELFAQPALQALGPVEALPGGGYTSPAQLDEFIRRTCGTGQHPVGTCKMGIGSDAVVDCELKVHGVTGLRVADASIMPGVPGGNTNGPTIMIGEKAADLLRQRR